MSRPGFRAILVLLFLVLLGWHVHARAKPESVRGSMDRALLSVSGPIQSLLARGVGGLGDLGSNYLLAVGARKENERLRAEAADLRARLIELDELRAENDRLRALDGLRARAPGRTVGARVIGRGTSSRFRTVRLDRGSDDGVRAGMAVVAPEGAVGQVLRASDSYCDVLLLTDGLSSAGALVHRSRLRGALVGDGGSGLGLGFVSRSDRGGVQAGDLLVTSGEDGVFPSGIALGRVTEASEPETGLFLHVLAEPVVRLDQLEEVLLVLDPGTGPFHAGTAPEPLPADAQAGSVDGAAAVAAGP